MECLRGDPVEMNEKRQPQPRTVIVGAGIAGLAAGKFLELEGLANYVILEASERIGGRIWSVPIGQNGFRAEMGANWIHGIKHNPVYKLADDNNLLTEQALQLTTKNICVSEKGDIIHESTVQKVDFDYGRMLSACEDYFLSRVVVDANESLGGELDALIEEKLANTAGHERHLLEMLYHQRRLLECCKSGCDNLYDVSLSQFGSYKELPGSHLVIPRGFSTILDIVRDCIPNEKIKLNTRVSNIFWGDNIPHSHIEESSTEDKICVQCDNGDIYWADHVIVTASLGVLKATADTMFNPPLTQTHLEAIQHLGFGVVNKVILIFDGPVVDQHVRSIQLAWETGHSTDSLRTGWFRKIYSLDVVRDNLLVGWLTGQEAMFMETLSDEELRQDMERVVQTFLQPLTDHIPSLTRVVRTCWSKSRHVLGSYSFIAVGATQEDIRNLRQPLTRLSRDGNKKPVVLFAGEATHPSFYSTAHGALLTGNREAARICQYWKPQEASSGRYDNLGLSDEEVSEEQESSEDEGLSFP